MKLRRELSENLLWHALLVFCAASALGCAANSQSDKLAAWDPAQLVAWNNREPEKPAPKVPTRLVATWTETVLNKADQPPQRGFGGRITFFTSESEDPVRVDGQLVVYAFDETGRAPHETRPTRRFIFPADEVERHESESALGPSYSFWLPWDEVGGPQTHISLIARFEPNGGPIVIGEQTKHFLPGATPDATQPQLAQPSRTDVLNGVRLANYSELAGGTNAASPAAPSAGQGGETSVLVDSNQMTTETIALPPRLAKALQADPRPQQNATTLPPDAAASVPISQLSQMRESGPLAPTEKVQTVTPPQASAPAESQAPLLPSRPIAAGRPAEPGSLRDSLLGTLPARARQAAQPAPDRAR
ncbi:MAG TPA: hypothetical protein VF175_12575 [Lacipirellula sp.]